MLKTLEGGVRMIVKALLEAFDRRRRTSEHADALMPALLPLYATLDPDTYGGAVLLGVDGVCIISHGSSRRDGDAQRASSVADEMVEQRHRRRAPRRHRLQSTGDRPAVA